MSNERELKMVQRHVCEGLKRLERQRVLISDLIGAGHHDLVPATERFLAQMEQHQAAVEHHLETLLREIPAAARQRESGTQTIRASASIQRSWH